MEQIYPLTAERIQGYVGRHVCAVMHDGSYFIGRLQGIDGQNLILDGNLQGPGAVTASNAKKAAKEIGKKAQKANTSAFFPFFNPFLFPLASLAFLFAFPFFI